MYSKLIFSSGCPLKLNLNIVQVEMNGNARVIASLSRLQIRIHKVHTFCSLTLVGWAVYFLRRVEGCSVYKNLTEVTCSPVWMINCCTNTIVYQSDCWKSKFNMNPMLVGQSVCHNFQLFFHAPVSCTCWSTYSRPYFSLCGTCYMVLHLLLCLLILFPL